MRILKALIVVLVLTTPALADSVVFTGGSAWVHWPALDPIFNITGQDTHLIGSRAVLIGVTFVATPPSFLLINTGGPVLVNGVLYGSLSQAGGDPLGLRMRFAHEPVPLSAFITNNATPPGLAFSTPFTMTGTLTVLDLTTNDPVTFDISGEGALNVSKVSDPFSTFPFVHVDFNFGKAATPVPESPWLLVVGLTALAFGSRRLARSIR